MYDETCRWLVLYVQGRCESAATSDHSGSGEVKVPSGNGQIRAASRQNTLKTSGAVLKRVLAKCFPMLLSFFQPIRRVVNTRSDLARICQMYDLLHLYRWFMPLCALIGRHCSMGPDNS